MWAGLMRCRYLLPLMLMCSIAKGEQYHFVSINHLVEQEIGRLILPQIYNKLNIEITITPLPGKRAEYQATSGASDGEIMRIYSYGVNNPSVHRVPTPYYQLETMAFIKKGAEITIETASDLKKYSLAKVRGVIHTNNITHGLYNVADLNSTEQIMRFVNLGRADVALTNTIDGLMVIKESGFDDIVPIAAPLAKLNLYHYVHEKHKYLIPKVDAQIKAMKKSGELDKIIKDAEFAIIEQSLLE